MHRPIVAAAVFLATQAAAIPPLPPPPPPAPPSKLQIAIHIDGLTAELLREYRPQLIGGLARLAEAPRGAPVAPAGGGQFVSVSGAAASSPAAGQAAPLLRFSWDGQGFAMAGAAAARPRSLTLLDAAIRKLVGRAEPPLVPPPYCLAKPASRGGRFARAAGDYAAYARSPSLDGATLALAAGLVQELRLGRDAAPDLLQVELPVTRQVVAAYGAGSEEACLQLFSLDRDLGDFLRAVDRMSIPYDVKLAVASVAG
jgi:hypothetical protein